MKNKSFFLFIAVFFIIISSCTISGMYNSAVGSWEFSSGKMITNQAGDNEADFILSSADSDMEALWASATQLTLLSTNTNTMTIDDILGNATIIIDIDSVTLSIPGHYSGTSLVTYGSGSGFRLVLSGRTIDFGYSVLFGSLTLAEFDGETRIEYYLSKIE